MAASEQVVDFTNVKDGGEAFNKKRQPAGDYKAKILSVKDAPTKETKEAQWLFAIQVGSGTYPYYCKLVENQFWKIRNLLVAAGMNVPKKRVKVDPNKLVGKTIAVTLEDDEYNGKLQSNIASTFPVSELDDQVDDEDDAEDEEDEVETPPPAKKKAAPVVEDDDEEEEEEPAPKAKKKAPAPADDDDDLEELDIDDV